MNSSTGRSIGLVIAAVILLAFGGFELSSDHMKTGIGLLALGVVVVGISLATFFMARSSA